MHHFYIRLHKKGMANEILSDVDSACQLDGTKPTLEDFKLLFGK